MCFQDYQREKTLPSKGSRMVMAASGHNSWEQKQRMQRSESNAGGFELSPECQLTAFIDRLHGILPGWELPKFDSNMIAQGVGIS